MWAHFTHCLRPRFSQRSFTVFRRRLRPRRNSVQDDGLFFKLTHHPAIRRLGARAGTANFHAMSTLAEIDAFEIVQYG
jgi:hypothetical protein